MSGGLPGSQNYSRNVLPKSEEQVSNEDTLMARNKEDTIWPISAHY